ncbi:MAG TPA: rRNA maturation RNase YbeY [Trueperaceae bacterium]|nr:rRNA maturation RNase YbeY [Trueperaceae bacterium]
MAVEIVDETHRFRQAEAAQRTLEALLTEQGSGDRDLTLVLVDDATIAVRNARDRGVEGATDVLSYPTAEPDDIGFPQVPHLGDIFISLDTAERQAAAHGHDLTREVLVLAAHGLTHLRGHDHVDEAAWAPFRQAERRVLELADAASAGEPPA